MSALWSSGPVSFAVTRGTAAAIELKVPRRGIIRALIVEEEVGADAGTIQLFSSREAVLTARGVGTSVPGYSVTPSLTITAGKYIGNELGYAYENQDGTTATPVCRLWALLTMTGASLAVAVKITVTVEPPTFI